MKVGILGGSFDPVHKGHLALARAAKNQLKLDRIYFVLSPRSPFKLKKQRTPAAARLQMLKAALKSHRNFFPGLWEMKRKGPSYTIDTLRHYARRNPGHELFLVLGSDTLRGFRRWKSPGEILGLAWLVVGRRPGSNLTISREIAPRLRVLKGRFPDVSSTGLRQYFRLNKHSRALPPAVAALVKKKHLYA